LCAAINQTPLDDEPIVHVDHVDHVDHVEPVEQVDLEARQRTE